ncbi:MULTISPECIES: glycosyltransferase [unclassified Pseudoalteromonas]|uniref:glycosyltransferase n=1 Tax=unclassified Pseudoalteromonas TaxID=194690 RepID=UPI0006D66802|nr:MULTISPECIES: glycosyltransferase [unclassified Pseudoalteromonas]KPZ52474.1 GalNAc-N,N'-diacetylbacillosaminyl-diphospho-undecaprenol 4-alpha-N-acetylgalactosaminyltransferase [Pseudoalteromonas sp. P1-25]KPZ56124.1 GalNAc-N,N'-diacetylbacillosaminyl-diphospho-undecaprenol 4-alpha-N-acetylgalactosaminyltransferase [Pseudoalteromonas sp. P1-7a]BED87970.1 hypothetical protein PspMM1_04380 [Pseudoalteromonas sp. MM1]
MKDNKITLFVSSLAGGGAEGVCVNVANGLAQSGWDVDLIVLHLKNAAYLERVNENVNLISLNAANARYAIIPLLKYIRKTKIEKLVVFKYELAVLLILLKSILRLNIKVIARNINTFSQSSGQGKGLWRKYIANPLIQHYFCKADHVINQCEAMQEDLLTTFPELKGKTSVILNPVAKHVEEYAENHNKENNNKQDYILCVGRLEKQKAFHFALEAFAQLNKSYPNLRLKIVGQGSLENELKSLAKQLKISGNIDFEGFQSHMLDYYLNAKVTLLTSIYEGFPNVLVESITLGTPVVSFDCPSGPREIIDQGINGYLVEYQSIDSLVSYLDKSLNTQFDSKAVMETAKKNKVSEVMKKYSKLLKNI